MSMWTCILSSRILKGMFASQTNCSTPSLPGCADDGDSYRTSALEDELFLQACDDDSSDSGEGSADPVQDDLYARRVLQTGHQTSVNTHADKFLPKYWTPNEDTHVGQIRQGSQRRPWYKKMQGFRLVRTSRCWIGFSRL